METHNANGIWMREEELMVAALFVVVTGGGGGRGTIANCITDTIMG